MRPATILQSSRRLIGFAGLIAILAASGCASVKLAPPDEDKRAKSMSAPSGKALVYVYRHELLGAAIAMRVRVDGKLIGHTRSKTYFLIEVPPGTYKISSHSENESAVELNAEAGKKYYLWQEVKLLGFIISRTKLQVVDEKTGRGQMMKCKLIKHVRLAPS